MNSQRPYARSVVLVFKPTTWESLLGKPRGLPWRPTRDVTTHHRTRWNKWRHVLPAATHSFLSSTSLTHHPLLILLILHLFSTLPHVLLPFLLGSPLQEVVQRDGNRRGNKDRARESRRTEARTDDVLRGKLWENYCPAIPFLYSYTYIPTLALRIFSSALPLISWSVDVKLTTML